VIGIGFQVWGQAVTWPELAETARRIEALGFTSLWSNDHFYPPTGAAARTPDAPAGPFLEGWMTLAGFIGVTSRIPVGVLVSGAGYRNPGLLVKMATAADHISAGRVILGLGAGWHEREHRTFGFDFPSLGDRISRLDEQSAAIRRLLDGEEVSVDGRFVRMDRAVNLPPPIHGRLPLLIGASGEKRSLRIVARDADIWNGEGDPETAARKNAVLDAHCRDLGRDPATIRRTVGVSPAFLRDDRDAAIAGQVDMLLAAGLDAADARETAEGSPFVGTDADVRPVLRAYEAAGIEELIVDQPGQSDEETLERLAAIRAAG
jgi:alkanesulfonate monooxygenase SsuD/methylene tetrahydromethanopterin reductase-like flavin-dependent oxidoreductase (luciferase family)